METYVENIATAHRIASSQVNVGDRALLAEVVRDDPLDVLETGDAAGFGLTCGDLLSSLQDGGAEAVMDHSALADLWELLELQGGMSCAHDNMTCVMLNVAGSIEAGVGVVLSQ